MPPDLLVIGVPLVIVVPAVVEGAKRMGLATRWAGVASVGSCGLVLGLLQLQGDPQVGGVATWALMSLIYGLAAAGLYSQVDKLQRG